MAFVPIVAQGMSDVKEREQRDESVLFLIQNVLVYNKRFKRVDLRDCIAAVVKLVVVIHSIRVVLKPEFEHAIEGSVFGEAFRPSIC